MKRIKYFVLSLFLCFSFGCTTTEETKINIKLLLNNLNNIENYQCTRVDTDEPFICVLRTTSENKLVKCSFNGCHFIECKNDSLCFKSNDTE